MAARYTQPQGGPVILKWDDPLTNKMVLASLPGVNKGFDAVSNKLPTTVIGTKIVTTPSGVASGFGATQGTASSDRITTGFNGAFPSLGRTYFFKARRNGAGGSGLGRLFDKTSGGTGQMLYWYNTQARLHYSFYAGGAERLIEIPGTNVTAAIGETFTVMVSHTQIGNSANIVVWVNGVQVLSDLGTTATFNDAASAFVSIGNRADGIRGWDGLIECAYVWDRALTSADAAALHSNPYRIFASQPRMSPILMAAAASTSPSQPVAANATIVEQADTVDSITKTDIVANSSHQESTDTISSAAVTLVKVSTSIGEQVDSISSIVGAISVISVSATVSEAGDTTTSSANVPAGVISSVVEQPELVVSQIGISVVAGGLVQEQVDTAISQVGIPLGATALVSEGADANISSTSNSILADVVSAEIPDSVSVTATVATSVEAGVSESPDTVLISSETGPVPLEATVQVYEEADTVNGTISVEDYAAYALNPKRKMFVKKEVRVIVVKKELRIVYAK